MASFTYTGSFSTQEITNNQPRTASLTGSGSASGVISSVSASASFIQQYNESFTVEATMNFGDGTTAAAQSTVTGNYGYPVSASFSFSGITVSQANNIQSITFVCTQTVSWQSALDITGSATVTVTYSPPGKLTAPRISVSATSTYDSAITVSWTASSDATANALTGYTLQYSNSDDNVSWGNWTTYGNYNINTLSVGANIAGVNKYRKFRVRATGSAGSSYYSDWSESSAVFHAPPTKVSTPVISVSTTATDSSTVIVSWTESRDGAANALNGYILQYSDSADGSLWGSWANYGTYEKTTRSVNAGLNDVRKYRKFRVRATGSAGSSYYSDWSESSAVFRYAVPTAPSNLAASPSTWEEGNLSLSWNASYVEGALINSYYIQYRLKPYGGSYGSWTNLANTSSTNYSYNPNLSKGDNIQYRVRALSNEGSYSSYSSAITVVRLTDRPKNLTPAAGWYETINVCSWELPPAIDLTGTVCQYQYSTDSGSTWSEWTNATGKSFDASTLFANVVSGAYFAYKVRAVQTNGDTSEETLSPSIYKNSAPSAPVIIAPVPASPTSPGAFWAVFSVSTDPNGHTMTAAYSRNGGDLVTIQGGLTAACVLAVKLTEGGTYRFRVTDEYGAYSETEKAVTVTAETYTDNPVTAGTTRIKAAHINELRSRIEQLCTLYGVTAPTWDEAIVAGTTSVKHFPAHIEELREAIEAIYAVINNMGAGTVIASPSWAAALTDIKPKAAAIEEVRAAARAI